MTDMKNCSDDELAALIAGATTEIAARCNHRERDLEAARRIWPQLEQSLRAAGRRLGPIIPQMYDSRPWLPEWSREPGCYIGSGTRPHGKPKTKRQAMELALTIGDSGFASVSELWLWVGGGGPIVDRALYDFGYYGKKSPPVPAWKIE